MIEQLKRIIKQIIEESKTIPTTELLYGLNLEVSGVCMLVAEKIAKYAIDNDIDIIIYEGHAKFEKYINGNSANSIKYQHTWCEYIDGPKIDPSIIQFARPGVELDISTIKYIKSKKRYTPKEYLELCEKYPIDDDIVKAATKL